MPTAGPREKIDGDGQTRDVGNDEGVGENAGVDKIDAEEAKFSRDWVEVNRCRKDHGFGLGMI